MRNYFDLSGRAAVVTGASRGIGKAIAKGLANAGAGVMVSDVLDTSGAVEEINASSAEGKAVGRETDVTDREAVRELMEETRAGFGTVDILVNNAGIYDPSPFEDLEDADWDRTLDVNLNGAYSCSKEAGKHMIDQGGGSIINVASVAGLFAFQDSGAYNVSKGGLLQLTRTIATEWGEHGIRANAICPGVIETDMTEDLLEDESFQEMINRRVSLERTGQPEEIAPTAVYLASDASSYMTGHAMVLDGGWTCHL